MAEIEFSILSKQSLNRRIPTEQKLITEMGAWESNRNNTKHTINWQFTTEDARIKLHKLYPTF